MKQWVSRLRPHAPGLIFGGFFCVMLALHAAMPVGLGDDPMYRDMLNRMSLWQFLTEHYATWSARSLVEAVLCTIAALPPAVWRVADALLVALCAFLAARTAGLERSPCGAAMAVLCFLCYDWTALSTAGWMCTTLVFVWPLAAALAAAQPLVQLARGAAPGRALCAASLLLLAYAANMEQALVVYTGCLAGVLLWHAAARRRVHWVVWAQLAVCAANALYAATCPGTAARIAGETTSWFTDFGMRTIWQNAELGISNAMYHVLYQKNILFFVFCVVLALAVAARHRAWYVRLFGVLPAVAVAVLGVGGPLAKKLVPSLSFFANVFTKDGYLNLLTVYSPKYWLAFLLLCAVLAACVLNLYLALGHTRAAFGAMLLFCAGFASYAGLFAHSDGVGPAHGVFLFDVGGGVHAAFVALAGCRARKAGLPGRAVRVHGVRRVVGRWPGCCAGAAVGLGAERKRGVS